MTDVQIVVPFGGDDPQRTKLRDWIVDRYRRLHPKWPVTIAMCDGEWSKGKAVNPVVAGLDPDVVVVADADSFVDPNLLIEAVEVAQRCGWAYPHGTTHRICEPDTERLLAGEDVSEPAVHVRPTNAVPGGGIVVVTREAWATVKGLDANFVGWGGEDQAFGMILEGLVGATVTPPRSNILWHLWHPEAPNWRNPSQATQERFHRYLAARRRPAHFRDLIGE